jgi:hypothetical protein
MEPAERPPTLRSPTTPSEWEAYFDRWRILRQPWGQPRGSERDSEDKMGISSPVDRRCREGFGLRSIAFERPWRSSGKIPWRSTNTRVGCGYGGRILDGLEAEARGHGARKIVLNACDNAVEFYRKHGYNVIGAAEPLFGVISHVRMAKSLS